MNRVSKPCALVINLVAASLLGGCGGGSSPTSPATPPPAGSFRTVLIGTDSPGATFELKPGQATYKNLDKPPDGTIDVTVDWAGSNDIQLIVTDNVCSGILDLRAGRCNVITKSDTAGVKPRKVTFATSTLAGKIWSFWIYNNGATTESGAMEAAVTTTQPIPPVVATPPPATSADPRDGLAAGPVVRYAIKLRSIDLGDFKYRDPEQDADGNWIVHPDEFVVFDSTQKNGAGELCKWVAPPTWKVEDPGFVFRIRGSSQPFLLRADVTKRGQVRISASIDGVDSNVLVIDSRPR
jgi:hypothetical protein